MDLISIFIIAISLSIDSFAASVVLGSNSSQFKITNILKVALIMSFFQVLMPFIGWGIGDKFKYLIESFDHWIAFVLLISVGGKMLYESLSKDDSSNNNFKISNFYVLVTLGISTSIDALVVGISFGILRVSVVTPIIIIGITTFLFSSVGVLLGGKFGKHLGGKFEIIGGVVLILLGIKILIEHLYFR